MVLLGKTTHCSLLQKKIVFVSSLSVNAEYNWLLKQRVGLKSLEIGIIKTMFSNNISMESV